MGKSLERRVLLRGAGVVGATAVGVAAVPAAAEADDHHGRHGLLGAWRITHTDDTPSGDTGDAVVTFSAGGVLTAEELSDGSLGLGAWRSDGSRFKARFFESSPGDGAEPGVVVEIRPRGHAHHDHVSGTYSATVRSAADGSVLQSFTGTFTGDRIQV